MRSLWLTALLLTGCPASYGLRVAVHGPGAEPLQVFAPPYDGSGAGLAEQLPTVPGLEIDCQGCAEPPRVLDGEGAWWIAPEGPGPVRLRISAPGHEVVVLRFDQAPPVTQLGPDFHLMVLKPHTQPSP